MLTLAALPPHPLAGSCSRERWQTARAVAHRFLVAALQKHLLASQGRRAGKVAAEAAAHGQRQPRG
jgi:hypothetical protein